MLPSRAAALFEIDNVPCLLLPRFPERGVMRHINQGRGKGSGTGNCRRGCEGEAPAGIRSSLGMSQGNERHRYGLGEPSIKEAKKTVNRSVSWVNPNI